MLWRVVAGRFSVMSALTATLLGQRKCRSDSMWPRVLSEVADRLVAQCGTPKLGNFRNPVKELFYILLSARTTETLYQRAYNNLMQRYPTVAKLAHAEAVDVYSCIADSGFGAKRSCQIVATAKRLQADFGGQAQAKLKTFSADEAFRYLTSLPGLGVKSALCVMMWSLDFDVFPVDANVQRILQRLGMIEENAKHREAQQRLPRFVPAGRSRELHSAMMVHGRKTCAPRIPKCGDCVIADLCQFGTRVLAQNK